MREPSIEIVTPAPRGSRGGNRITALRWARILRSLGCRVRVGERWSGSASSILVALHASKSAESVERFRRERPRAPLVVGLAGTDVYGGLDSTALGSLERATAIVALQELAADEVPPELRAKVRVIHQSAPA